MKFVKCECDSQPRLTKLFNPFAYQVISKVWSQCRS